MIAEMKKESTKKIENVDQLLNHWHCFYKKVFGLEKDFSKLKIPPMEEKEKFRHIFMAKELFYEKIITDLRKFFTFYSYYKPIDFLKFTEARKIDSADYVIRIKAFSRSETDLNNIPIARFDPQDFKEHITAAERLVKHAEHFYLKGSHMNRWGETICLATSDHKGKVPIIGFDKDDKKLIFMPLPAPSFHSISLHFHKIY